MIKMNIIRLVFLFVLLMQTSHAADSNDSAPDVVRLKVPVKVVLPNAGPGGINEEVEHWGFIDQTGKLVIPAEWDSVSDFHEGIACVKRGDKLGFIDESGKIVSEPQWEADEIVDAFGTLNEGFAPEFSEGLVAVEKDKKWGYLDRTGKLAVPLRWQLVREFKDGLAAVAKPINKYQSVWGFIDKTGKVVVEPRWARADSFHDGLALVGSPDNSKQQQIAYGFIDKTGRIVVKPQFDWASDFSSGVARVVIKEGQIEKNGSVDSAGKVTFLPTGVDASDISEGVAIVKSASDGHWSLIDKDGKTVALPDWEDIKPFSCGLAPFETKDFHTGFIDKTGKVVIPPVWDGAWEFQDGICWVTKRGRYGAIDLTGKVLIPPEWQNIEIKNGYCFAYRLANPAFGESYAWFDKTGKMIWQSEDSH
jgi:hypothetical protein